MAEKACHVFGSATQVGLTQALDRMKEKTARLVRLVLTKAGLVASTLSLFSMTLNYSQLYYLASTGHSRDGRSISDFPSTLMFHVFVVLAGLLVYELGEWTYKRSGHRNLDRDAV